jgi:hypothetical protein
VRDYLMTLRLRRTSPISRGLRGWIHSAPLTSSVTITAAKRAHEDVGQIGSLPFAAGAAAKILNLLAVDSHSEEKK